jgi:elongation factor 1-alpha
LRLPLQDVYSITGVGTVPVGRVETGTFKVGDKVIIMPNGATAEVKSIESHHVDLQQASAGDNIGFNLRGVDKKDIRRGDVIGPVDDPPKVVKEFTAQIIVVHHPTAIAPGYTPVIHAHTSQAAATITKIVSKLDPQTGGVLDDAPKALKTGDAAIVEIQPLRPLCLETFAEYPQLGRFALRDMGTTIAAGVVKKINAEWDMK